MCTENLSQSLPEGTGITRLNQLRERCQQSDQMAESLVRRLGDRESLAMQCLLVRDFYHLLELYCHCLRTLQSEEPETQASAPPHKPKRQQRVEEKKKLLPFSEWLFDSA